MSKQPTTQITIKITEADRKKAKRYGDIEGCIIFTALKRAGHHPESVGSLSAKINGLEYEFDPETPGLDTRVCANLDAEKAPYYGKRVVGKKFVFNRA
jgi:hypothetical protein